MKFWLGVVILFVVLLAGLWFFISSNWAAYEARCAAAGGHVYQQGRIHLCLDSEGRVIEFGR